MNIPSLSVIVRIAVSMATVAPLVELRPSVTFSIKSSTIISSVMLTSTHCDALLPLVKVMSGEAIL